MSGLDPRPWAELIEEHFGRRFGRFMIKMLLAFTMLAVIGFALFIFFKQFVGELVWPFLVNLFGFPRSGISLDNIESVIIVLTAAIVFFVAIISVFLLFAMRAVRRRIVPQPMIDELAKYRSTGISILNDRPEDDGAGLKKWHGRWQEWRDGVVEYLRKNFTKAETLSFDRLGLITPLSWGGLPISPEHAHYLSQLAKQLTILEGLIQRHQDRH
jgi:hypothetical protein